MIPGMAIYSDHKSRLFVIHLHGRVVTVNYILVHNL